MKFARVVFTVWCKDTKWGDRVCVYSEATQWREACALTTSHEKFPWWSGEMVVNMDVFTKSAMEYKFVVWRDGQEIWETFKTNRSILLFANSPSKICAKFGEPTWICPVCQTALDEIPILCKSMHPVHVDCFETYVSAELGKSTITLPLCCQKCFMPLSDAWKDQVSPGLLKRYQRVCMELEGGTVVTCPMANCDFEVVYPAGDFSMPDNEQCHKCGCVWCAKCNRAGTLEGGDCKVCANGLKDVADQIFDALDEISGAKCPSCSQRGQKMSSECTHITCDCGEVYCYCCGLPGSAVDTSDDYASTDMDKLYGHNDDYYSNSSRCPMWLVNYADVYDDWPGDSDDAQERFHTMRAHRRLRDVQAKVSACDWDLFMEVHEHVKKQVDKYLSEDFTTSAY